MGNTPVISQPQTSNPEPTTDPERQQTRNRQQTQSLLQNLQRKWWRRILASSTLRLRSRRIIRGMRRRRFLSMRLKAAVLWWIIFGTLTDPSTPLPMWNPREKLLPPTWFRIIRSLLPDPIRWEAQAPIKSILKSPTAKGVSNEVVIMAVEGYDFGCYFIFTYYPKGDKAAEAEIHSIIQSFKSNGAPETNVQDVLWL